MNRLIRFRHLPRPQQPPINHLTTTVILKYTTVIFYSHLCTFLTLSLILWDIRSTIEKFYVGLTDDFDPSIKALLTRKDYPVAHRIRQRRPESQPSPPGALDDNFFSGDSYDRFHLKQFNRNTTNSILGRGIVLDDFSFRAEIPNGDKFIEEDEVSKSMERNLDEPHIEFDLELLRKGLVNGRHDVNILFSLAYVFAFITSIFAYTWARGIVLLQVVDHFSGNQRSLLHYIDYGLRFGFGGLWRVSFLNWWARDKLVRLISRISYEIENYYVFLVVAMRAMFIPFINLAPWVQGPRWETTDFMVKWFFTDLIAGFIFSVGSWVAIVERPINITGIFRESYSIFAASLSPAIEIRILEAIICGSVGRGIVWVVLGNYCSLAFQCVMEVFFLVAWLLYYLSARGLLRRGQVEVLPAH
ncbi:hypothetical protein Adt_32193 [Abeliophyllum distichum]|uniref:Uncharacterized protein n=1 Tax=Abeliophyllum distichum TaxID=126358 RepID=A0ABD1RG96_9LAMI